MESRRKKKTSKEGLEQSQEESYRNNESRSQPLLAGRQVPPPLVLKNSVTLGITEFDTE